MPTFRLKQDQAALLVMDIQERLMRLGTHPAARWDELLPHRWRPSSASAPDSS